MGQKSHSQGKNAESQPTQGEGKVSLEYRPVTPNTKPLRYNGTRGELQWQRDLTAETMPTTSAVPAHIQEREQMRYDTPKASPSKCKVTKSKSPHKVIRVHYEGDLSPSQGLGKRSDDRSKAPDCHINRSLQAKKENACRYRDTRKFVEITEEGNDTCLHSSYAEKNIDTNHWKHERDEGRHKVNGGDVQESSSIYSQEKGEDGLIHDLRIPEPLNIPAIKEPAPLKGESGNLELSPSRRKQQCQSILLSYERYAASASASHEDTADVGACKPQIYDSPPKHPTVGRHLEHHQPASYHQCSVSSSPVKVQKQPPQGQIAPQSHSISPTMPPMYLAERNFFCDTRDVARRQQQIKAQEKEYLEPARSFRQNASVLTPVVIPPPPVTRASTTAASTPSPFWLEKEIEPEEIHSDPTTPGGQPNKHGSAKEEKNGDLPSGNIDDEDATTEAITSFTPLSPYFNNGISALEGGVQGGRQMATTGPRRKEKIMIGERGWLEDTAVDHFSSISPHKKKKRSSRGSLGGACEGRGGVGKKTGNFLEGLKKKAKEIVSFFFFFFFPYYPMSLISLTLF